MTCNSDSAERYRDSIEMERHSCLKSDREEMEEEIEALKEERDELAAQIEVMREALCNLLHRAPAVLDCNDLTHAKKHRHRYDEPCPVTELYDDARDAASEAIALPNTAGTILRQRDARTAASALRYYVKTIPGGSIIDPQWIADDMRRVADELEKQNG